MHGGEGSHGPKACHGLSVVVAMGFAPAQSLPTLVIDPPQDFLRSPASGANVQWFDSTIVNATLRIYPFPAFTLQLR